MKTLQVDNLSHSYGVRPALQDVSFALEQGQFCALLGPNGAGKSTLFGLLTRLITTRTGRIAISGHNLQDAPLAAMARIGIVFQQPTLDLDTTVWNNMKYFAALHGLSGENAQSRIEDTLARLDMAERKGEMVRALNGGHRRRMEIARALIHRPDLLLLDEPTVGLDMRSRTAITDYAHGLAASGTTVLWATHLVDEIRPTDRVIVLHRGAVLRDSLGAALAQGGTLQDTYLALTSDEAAP